VLFQLKPNLDGTYSERFFVLTHREICEAQASRNAAYATKYEAKHGSLPDFSSGVDNVTVADVEQYEDALSKVIECIER
jgi:hypothetical protein